MYHLSFLLGVLQFEEYIVDTSFDHEPWTCFLRTCTIISVRCWSSSYQSSHRPRPKISITLNWVLANEKLHSSLHSVFCSTLVSRSGSHYSVLGKVFITHDCLALNGSYSRPFLYETWTAVSTEWVDASDRWCQRLSVPIVFILFYSLLLKW